MPEEYREILSIREYQVKNPRFWKEFTRNYFAAVGLIALPIGVCSLLWLDSFEGLWPIAAIIGILILFWSLYTVRHREPAQTYRCNTTIRLVVGDIFDEDDAHIMIGMPSTFDTDVDGGIIARDSLQAQYIERHHNGSTSLNYAIDQALKPIVPIGKINKPGKRDVYPIGTVATISLPAGKSYFFVAYADPDVHNIPHGTTEGIIGSLHRLWDECERVGNERAICVPLIDQGMGGIAGLSADSILRIIAFSYLVRSQQRRFSEELRIIVRPSVADSIDRQEFQAFLTSLEP